MVLARMKNFAGICILLVELFQKHICYIMLFFICTFLRDLVFNICFNETLLKVYSICGRLYKEMKIVFENTIDEISI